MASGVSGVVVMVAAMFVITYLQDYHFIEASNYQVVMDFRVDRSVEISKVD